MCSVLNKKYPSPPLSGTLSRKGRGRIPQTLVTLPSPLAGEGDATRRERGIKKISLYIIFLVIILFSAPTFAVEPNEVMSDLAQEQRARSLSLELRCLVCQNQSIDDSNAGLAKDLRIVVRERILAGDNDEAVKAYLVARYGEFVLLKPSFSAKNFLLWSLPFFGLAVGVFLVFRRRKLAEVSGLSEEERSRLLIVLDGQRKD